MDTPNVFKKKSIVNLKKEIREQREKIIELTNSSHSLTNLFENLAKDYCDTEKGSNTDYCKITKK